METVNNILSGKSEELTTDATTEKNNCSYCGAELINGFSWCDIPFCDVDCRKNYDEKKKVEDEKKHMQAKKKTRLKKHSEFAEMCGVKKRHKDCTLENFIGDTSFIVEWEKDKTQNILLHSANAGSGKTHLAVALLKYIGGNYPIKYGRGATDDFNFVSSSQLMMDIRSTFDSKDKSDAEIIEKLSNVPRLVIDDIGAEKVSEYVVGVIYLILNNRYENTLPTIITTNLNAEQMATYYNQRIVSRIVSGIVVKLKGSDMRVNNSKKF